MPSYNMLPIVLAQYRRRGMTVGQEEQFHWALVIICDRLQLSGPAMELVSREGLDAYGNAVTFLGVSTRTVALTKTVKCLGGVQVGAVPAPAANDLLRMVGNHRADNSKNCQDWIVEVIGIMRGQGFINERVVPAMMNPRDSLLPILRQVSRATADANPLECGFITKSAFQPVIQWIRW